MSKLRDKKPQDKEVEAMTQPSELEEIMPRCKTKDIHDFPDLMEHGRCWNCKTWDAIDERIQQEKNKLLLNEWRGIKALLLANEHHQDTKWLQDIADRTIAHAEPVEIIKGRKK